MLPPQSPLSTRLRWAVPAGHIQQLLHFSCQIEHPGLARDSRTRETWGVCEQQREKGFGFAADSSGLCGGRKIFPGVISVFPLLARGEMAL